MEFQNLIVDEQTTILEAMGALDRSAKKVLFVLRENRLVAAVSDGDIRRWILKKGDLNATIASCANYHPKYLMMEEREAAKDYMTQNYVEVLPILDQNHAICDVVCLYDEVTEQANTTHSNALAGIPVVIMAGGLGTRLYPYTKILPKPLIPIGDIPITEHIINQFRNYGCTDFYLIINHKKNMIKAYYNEIDKDYNLYYIEENKPLGTGGGVSLLKGLINNTFILTNCDTLIEADYAKIIREHQQKKNEITMICSLMNVKIAYGVVEIEEDGGLKSMKEKPSYSFLTNTGTYVVEPDVIDQVKEDVVIGFPDVIQGVKDKNKKVGVYPISEEEWLDMGQFDTLDKMREKLGV